MIISSRSLFYTWNRNCNYIHVLYVFLRHKGWVLSFMCIAWSYAHFSERDAPLVNLSTNIYCISDLILYRHIHDLWPDRFLFFSVMENFFHVWVEGYSECSLIKAHRHVLMLLKGVNWILSGVQKTNLTSCKCCFWYVFNWKIIRLNSVVNYYFCLGILPRHYIHQCYTCIPKQ